MRKQKRLTALLLAVLLLCGCGTVGTADTRTAEGESALQESALENTAPAEPAGESGESASASEREEDLFDLCSTARPERQNGTDETVTLMVYMVGSDLESAGAAATEDMQEMQDSGVDLSRVNLLIYTGGASEWHNGVPADVNALLQLTENGFVTLETRELSSMGDPANLTWLLNYGCSNFPADSYALILWDHGNGPVMGYGSDKNFGNDALTLPEIQTALDNSLFRTDNRLSFIGFDACLMASAELAITLSDYTDLLVSSQETEPGYGWNYAFLSEVGTEQAETLACDIVDAFVDYSRAYCAEHEFGCGDVTLSVTDLRQAPELETALDALFNAAAEDVSLEFSALAAERVKTRSLGRASTGSEYDLVDIGSLMTVMEAEYPAETARVKAVLEKMVIYSGSNAAETCGLSLYYPCYNKKYFQKLWQAGYRELDVLPGYKEYLDLYTTYWLGSDLSAYFRDRLTASENENGTYALQLTADQESVFASAGYYILERYSEGAYMPIYYSGNVTDSNGLLTADYSGNVLYCCNDYGESFIPVTVAHDTVDGMENYSVTGCFGENFISVELGENTRNCRIRLAVEQATGEVTVKSVTEITDDSDLQTGKQQEADLSEYPAALFYYVSPRYLERDADGRILPFFEWEWTGTLMGREFSTLNGLNFRMLPLYDDGSEYYIMFEITDVTGASYSSELLPITPAEAPAAEKTECTELCLEADGTAVLCDTGDVTVRMALAVNPETGRTEPVCSCSSTSEHEIRVQLMDCMINGTVYAGDESLYVETGESENRCCDGWNEACMYAGIGVPESLQFTLLVYDTENGKYIVYDTPVMLTVPEGTTPQQLWEPVYGAEAGLQKLVSISGCTVTLEALGCPLTEDPNYLTMQLRADNTAAENAVVTVEAVRVNGVSCPAYVTMSVRAGCSSVQLGQVSLSEAMQRCGMKEIASVALYVTIQTESETVSGWYRVALTQSGNETAFEPDAQQLLYEGNGVRIWLLGCEENYLCCWYMAVEQTGSTELYLRGTGTASDDSGLYGLSSTLYPDCITILTVSCWSSTAPESAELIFNWGEEVCGEMPYSTGMLTVPFQTEEVQP